jgi:hypothetical protein
MNSNLIIKFACISSKFAPKRKLVNFSLPKFRQKLEEFTDPDLISWVNNLYQDRTFRTRDEFNRAYDSGDHRWENKPMILTKDDVKDLREQMNEGAFDDGPKEAINKLITRIETVIVADKIVFVY